jgi:hypothetical protein
MKSIFSSTTAKKVTNKDAIFQNPFIRFEDEEQLVQPQVNSRHPSGYGFFGVMKSFFSCGLWCKPKNKKDPQIELLNLDDEPEVDQYIRGSTDLR